MDSGDTCTLWYNNTLISKQQSSTKELNVVDIFNFIIILFRLRVMSESPDNEVRFRSEEREGAHDTRIIITMKTLMRR